MDTTAAAEPRAALGRRLVRAGAVVVATVVLGLGLGVAPADAAPNNPCATSRAAFRAAMDEARFWIGAADRLAGAGNSAGADAAQAEAEHYLGQAENALSGMRAC